MVCDLGLVWRHLVIRCFFDFLGWEWLLWHWIEWNLPFGVVGVWFICEIVTFTALTDFWSADWIWWLVRIRLSHISVDEAVSRIDCYLHWYAILISLLAEFVALLLCLLAITVVVRLLNDVWYAHHLSELVLSLGAKSTPGQFHWLLAVKILDLLL